MRRVDRGDLLLAGAAAMIVGSALLYGSLLWTWLSDKPAPRRSAAPAASPAAKSDPAELVAARRAFRDRFLDPRTWLALSEALARAGRPIDAFYVAREAREFFSAEEFRKAHALVVLKAQPEEPGDEAQLKSRLKSDPGDPGILLALSRLHRLKDDVAQANRSLELGLAAHPQHPGLLLEKARVAEKADVLSAIPYYARAVHADPDRYEGRVALARLRQLAGFSELGSQGENSRLAREALEELRKAHPRDAAIFSALGLALLDRGDVSTLRALTLEAGRKDADAADAALIEGALALHEHDPVTAATRFTAAWERDPEDLYSAEKLAVIYAQQRGDEEAALPYWIALYRHEPARRWSADPLELVIRRALDARRKAQLKNIMGDGLGRFFASEDASLRAEACERAATLKDPRWIEALPELLDDDTDLVRRNADYALYQLAKVLPDNVHVRRDAWLSSGRPLLRARALNVFADLWPEETLPLALAALTDPNPGLRYLVKTLILDRYYAQTPAAKKAVSEYLARERDSLVVARYTEDKLRAQDQR
jgi:thioredoxin-like negative regulator of GroEL